MNNIDKPFSFRTLFSEKFLVPQRDLGRRPDQSLTQEAQESFLSKKVEVYVNEIVIPKMQRDYAQGRPNEEEVRENFLQSLYDALVDDTGRKRCSLNFIYGHFLESQDNAGYVSFVPYDGQQRLTTLYLLHWYASRKEPQLNVSEDYLRGFRYDTRFSSTTFTTMFLPGVKTLQLSDAEAAWLKNLKLIGAVAGTMVPNGKVGGEGIFSLWLQNKDGFARSWQNDPTVRGMLEMLDAIHTKFHDVPNLWRKLCETDPSRMPIYFFFQEVSRSSEAGSIFIKMNSRGKLLTEFECFKADFLRLLRKGNYPEDKRKVLAERIDRTWEQSFWNLARRQNIKETDTDVLLMRYVNFVIDLIGFEFEREGFQNRNGRLHLYSSERLKQVVLLPDGSLNEDAVEKLVFAVNTWCSADAKPDEYFQNLFRKEELDGGEKGECSRIRLFFPPEPKDIFLTIVRGSELSMNAVAVFHAVLVARRLELASDLFDSRLRSIRNLVYFMDKGVNELPYILQKVRLVMQNGMKVDFSNETSTRKFIDTQIREEQFKEWLSSRDPNRYLEIRKLEESDWFKGQVGVLLQEALDATKEEDERLSFLDNVFAKREQLFARIFCSGKIPDSTIRKALFFTSNTGFDYWVSSNGWFWMGASIYDFAWKAAHPFFTRDGKPQEALRALLDDPFFDTANGSGKDLLEAFANRSRPSGDGAERRFDVVYYQDRYYDDFFERWTENDVAGHGKCVGRILSGNGGLTMQMLDGKTRSSPYWDPYLYVALKRVDENSVKSNGKGAFKDLFKQYDVWNNRCSVVHRGSQAEIWYGPYGVHIKASGESYLSIRNALDLNIEMEQIDQVAEENENHEWLIRTRSVDDQCYCDFKDRIEVCEKLLKAVLETHSANSN